MSRPGPDPRVQPTLALEIDVGWKPKGPDGGEVRTLQGYALHVFPHNDTWVCRVRGPRGVIWKGTVQSRLKERAKEVGEQLVETFARVKLR